MSTQLTIKQEAKSRGSKTYFTGNACCRGHTTDRYVSNSQCVDCTKEYNHNNPEARRIAIWKFYGCPEPTRPEPNTCEICNSAPSGRYSHLVLDHCHTTGIFRGWLCADCNLALGKLGDNKQGITKALAYLNKVEN